MPLIGWWSSMKNFQESSVQEKKLDSIIDVENCDESDAESLLAEENVSSTSVDESRAKDFLLDQEADKEIRANMMRNVSKGSEDSSIEGSFYYPMVWVW